MLLKNKILLAFIIVLAIIIVVSIIMIVLMLTDDKYKNISIAGVVLIVIGSMSSILLNVVFFMFATKKKPLKKELELIDTTKQYNPLPQKVFSNYIHSVQDIYQHLPENYGDIKLENFSNDQYFNPIVSIVIPTFGRSQYVEKCFESLSKSKMNPKDVLLIIVDETMTKPNTDTKTYELVQNFYIPDIKTIKIFKHKHGNMFDSIKAGHDIGYQYCKYLINLDSDTIQSPYWVQKCIETFEIASKDFVQTPIVLSAINTQLHDKKIMDRKDYYVKKSCAGVHLMIESNYYLQYMRPCLTGLYFDTYLGNIMREYGKIIYTKKSYVQHTGTFGLHSFGWKDTALDFKE